MILNLPYIFATDNGIYFFDNSTSIILPINEKEKEFLEGLELNTSIDDYLITEEVKGIYENIKSLGLFSKRSELLSTNITAEYVEKQIKEQGISHLCLIVTDDCNFRCKYCIYSDYYFYSKSFSNRCMTLDVARKAVDYYFKNNIEALKFNPQLISSIGFYGGEPLLNWKLIKEVVKYSKKYDENCYFSITTNGYLLDKEKIKFMLNNNFSISVSLDGGKDQHDKNRIDRCGNGTFDRVFKNILMLQDMIDKNPDSEIKNRMFYILITKDNLSDLDSINNFFKKYPNIRQHVFSVANVNAMNTDYYKNQNSEEVLKKRNKQILKLLDDYKRNENKNDRFLKAFFSDTTTAVDQLSNYQENLLLGACIPGAHKLTVGTDGRFHACEKINQNYSIGSVYEGLKYTEISKYLNKILNIRRKYCTDCNLLNLCSLCLAHMESESDLEFNHSHCISVKESMKTKLGICYSLKESRQWR